MRSLRRKLTVALTLCTVATAAVGLLSYAVPLRPVRHIADQGNNMDRTLFDIEGGYIRYQRGRSIAPPPARTTAPTQIADVQFLGFVWFEEVAPSVGLYSRATGWQYFYNVHETMIQISVWHLVVLFALVPALARVHRLRVVARRRSGGLCLACGYDLAGNISATCPECGEEIQSCDDASAKD